MTSHLLRTTAKTAATASAAAPWNAKLQELSRQGRFQEGLSLYRRMLRASASPNAFTFPFALKSCAALSLALAGELLHCHVVKSGCESEPFVQTALISMYCKCGRVEDAYKVFDQNPHSRKLTVCYNALISGCVKNSDFRNGVLLFREMRSTGVAISSVTMLGLVSGCNAPMFLHIGMSFHSLNVKCGLDTYLAIVNCILTMYLRCGAIELARSLFDHTSKKELITWNAMITGYAQDGRAPEVLKLYEEMESSGPRPDQVTLVAVLSACADLGAKKKGSEVEKRIESFGPAFSNTFLKNGLINMYARCGDVARARAIFDDVAEKNLVTWTCMIGGYGMHGQGETAARLFDEMVSSGTRPDRTALVAVLSACSHSGLTDRGLHYFSTMKTGFGLEPGPEHYSCAVDLLGRAGRLQEAYQLILGMKTTKPDGAVWGALLGACRIHKNAELAEVAFDNIVQVDPTNTGYYVLLSNIYNDAKHSEGIQRVRAMVRERRLRKDPGFSYVEIKGKIHLFVADDKTHSHLREIHDMVDRLVGDGDEDEGDGRARRHSERLAIGYAIMNTEAGEEVVVIKNLRICKECHMFMKKVSRKLGDRLFVVRDATRFHHFRNGFCSCHDFW